MNPDKCPDTVFTNGRIYTLDTASALAGAVAVRDGRIVAVGSSAEIEDRFRGSVRVDLQGKTVIPGLIDAHGHFIDHGVASTRSVDLTGSRSIDEVLERLRTFRERCPHHPWLLGSRFDQELFADGRWITRSDLDKVSTDIPIMITRVCLHAIVVNSAALKLVKSELSREQVATGLLTEGASGLIWREIPAPTPDELREAALWVFTEARRVGLTGLHCMVEGVEDLEAVRSLHRDGRLPVRIRLMCPPGLVKKLSPEGLATGSGDEWLSVGSMKLFMDGSMGASTAAMKEPYAEDASNTGELFQNERELAKTLAEAQAAGWQAAIHAIGDLAVETAIRGIQLAAPKGNPLRHRIEHASQMTAAAVKSMAGLKIPACVQPQFITTDFWTPQRVGRERYRWSYPFRTMLQAGIPMAMGSDCPVERLDPFELIDRAANREPLSLGERLSVEEALRAYTQGSAYAGFDEETRGSIEPGKLADMVVLSEDIFEIDPTRITDVRAEEVIVGGRVGGG